MLSDVAVGAVISAVTTGFFAILWQRFHNVRPNKRLNEHLSKRLDALAATALELAVEDATEIEEASLSFTQVADEIVVSWCSDELNVSNTSSTCFDMPNT